MKIWDKATAGIQRACELHFSCDFRQTEILLVSPTHDQFANWINCSLRFFYFLPFPYINPLFFRPFFYYLFFCFTNMQLIFRIFIVKIVGTFISYKSGHNFSCDFFSPDWNSTGIAHSWSNCIFNLIVLFDSSIFFLFLILTLFLLTFLLLFFLQFY